MIPPAPVVGRRRRGRPLGEVGVVALAASTWLGVVLARPVPLAVGALVVVVAFAWRRGWLLVLGAGLLGSGLAAAAWAGLAAVTEAPYAGPVRLATDPGEVGGAVRADADLADGRRIEVWARGRPASSLQVLLAGETVDVGGRLEPPPPGADWLAPRHVVGRLSVTSLDPLAEVDRGRPWDVAANDLHRLLASGARALPTEQVPLFLGFVLGDDRGQDPTVVSDFRGAGLSHLLVVSGENVAFVLALAAPLVARVRLSLRLALTIGILAWFALLTRFEPSVLRATCMAGVAALAAYRGSPVSGRRVLALAVALLLLTDPLLQGALGFRLSVAASAGIIELAPRLAPHLPGGRRLRQAAAVSVGAQLGVAPLLLPAFGGIPAVSLVANLLAVPAAGPVMMWGLVAGPVAGGLRAAGADALAAGVLLPIRLLLAWVAAVARVATAAPLGTLGAGHVLALGGATVGFVLAGRTGRVGWRRAAAVAFGAVLLLPAVTGSPPPAAHEVVVPGVEVWRDEASGAAVARVSGAVTRADEVLDRLRDDGTRTLDAVVVTSPARQAAAVVAALRSRLDVGVVWVPDDGRVPEATTPAVGQVVAVGGLTLEVRAVSPVLSVDVRGPPPPV